MTQQKAQKSIFRGLFRRGSEVQHDGGSVSPHQQDAPAATGATGIVMGEAPPLAAAISAQVAAAKTQGLSHRLGGWLSNTANIAGASDLHKSALKYHHTGLSRLALVRRAPCVMGYPATPGGVPGPVTAVVFVFRCRGALQAVDAPASQGNGST